MRRESDLPLEHQQSHASPGFSSGFSAPTRRIEEPKNKNFATPPPLHGRLFSVYVTTSAINVLLNNINRRALVIQNLSANNIYIGVATPPSFDGTNYQSALLVPSGGILTLESDICPVEDIYALSDSATGAQISVMECII